MNHRSIDYMNSEGLGFFGEISASISHELKNILAIISESAGFLNDLTQMSRQGKHIELSMLETCSNNITEEIQRGFRTIRQMNRFAHSVDVAVTDADVTEILELAIGLSRFLSFKKKVRVDGSPAGIRMTTNPFLLQALFYRTLCAMFREMGTDDTVRVSVGDLDESRVHLTFSCDSGCALKNLPNQEIQAIAGVLGAGLTLEAPFVRLDIGLSGISDKHIHDSDK